MATEKNGKLIVLEGGDGSGKQTQADLLIKRLRREGRNVETIDFPQYETFYGRIIRAYLDGKFGDPTKIPPIESGALFCLNRFEAKRKIIDWLAQGKLVVCDRYNTANIIHQGAKLAADERKKFAATMNELEFAALGLPTPDLVIYLHVPPEAARKMMIDQGRVLDGLEDDLEYAKKVEETALWACKEFGWQIVECCKGGEILSREEIHEMIWTEIEKISTDAGWIINA